MTIDEKQTKANEYANFCARIGEQTIIILNAEIEIAKLQGIAKAILEELKDANEVK